ncbi:ABC-type molybdenum transport system ATPase subunit/photorepair protein PhrA [Streptosporangium becharense]|uniref:ABC-type molybdenum transport system ATPase subunit/photorepair protein PhrA n=1 Tax=Streptosporangium becharense TaxID=1816182 RepID=A0A7W9MJR6_9ACTN|nr:hypothetical protein [Streptosporangium becharense]MBB2910243.1 ABC-type molybdenum transport system ATPase subunit/photorepair protein PhrA [Streptosporangium becharense]MBB5822986.1 ABC-type molybdenum transport system ATPase subunit/photorepair protein PhrA [Streptosporangium becharense]
MGEPVPGAVELSDVSVRVVGRTPLGDIDWRVGYGEHWVVLGPNGAGKPDAGL